MVVQRSPNRSPAGSLRLLGIHGKRRMGHLELMGESNRKVLRLLSGAVPRCEVLPPPEEKNPVREEPCTTRSTWSCPVCSPWCS
uniref:Uncharacterized protein n=1 Tax=Steinernema glaseri TaxID=37863 RepID=A0A1I8A022_9BILA